MYTFLKALSELYNISKIVQVVSESVPFTVTSTLKSVSERECVSETESENMLSM